MPVTVTNIGTATGASGATLAITVPAAGVPAGQLIIVAVTEKSTSGTSGTLADTAGNTWNTAIGVNLAGLAADGRGTLFYAWNSKALVSGNTITYTRNLSAASCAMSACWVSGIFNNADPRDSAVQNSATGTTGTITVTSTGTIPTWDWILGVLFDSGTSTAGGNATFTQASGYATPPNEATTGGSGGSRVDAGNRRNTGAAASFTYNPTLSSTAQQWADVITAFKSIPDNLLVTRITDLANPVPPFRSEQTWYRTNLLQTTLAPPPAVNAIFRGILRSLPDQPYPPNAFQSWTWSYNLNLIGKDRMLAGKQITDRPQLAPIPPENLKTWIWSYNLNLIGKDRLPVGSRFYDLPPLPAQQPALWFQPYNLALYFVPPVVANVIFRGILRSLPDQPVQQSVPQSAFQSFNVLQPTVVTYIIRQSDWPVPQAPYRIDQTWTWSYNLNLIGQDRLPVGEQVTDLPPRDFARLFQTWIQSVNLALTQAPPNLYAQARQQDWPVPQAPSRLDQTWAASYNPNLIGQDQLPIRQQDWPLTPAAQRAADLSTWIDRTKFLLQRPFKQTDWPNPTQPAREPSLNSFVGRYNLNLIGKDRLPFRQQDWPLSSGHIFPPLQIMVAGKPFFLVPPVVGPLGVVANQYDWPLPQRRTDQPADQFFTGVRYPIIPPPPTPAVPPLRTLMGTGI